MWLSVCVSQYLKQTTFVKFCFISVGKQTYHFICYQTSKRSISAVLMEMEEPVIKVTQGLIKGLKRKTIYDHDFYSFEGIPYAQSPVGELRFKASLPAREWSGVRNCQECEAKPVQKNHSGETEGTEDCLYLNVFAKKIDGHPKLPVMVWIYGGAFNTGSALRIKYSPDYFMQENIILVTFNYRLSSLGFLSLKDPLCEVPGNAGLKDQVLALKWIRDNISNFGGDKDNITLFGESAGAAAVHYMTATQQTKGLFHKAVCMSGCISNPWAFNSNPENLAYSLACDKGYNGPNDDSLILLFLRNLPAEQLVLVDKLNLECVSEGGFYAFTPSLEPYDTEGAVIRKPLDELIKCSWDKDIPMMIGGTSFEGLVRYSHLKNKGILEMHNENPSLYFSKKVLKKLTPEGKDTAVQQLKELHFKDSSDVMGFMDYDTFSSFWVGLYDLVKSRRHVCNVPTYQYVFDFDSPTFNHHRTMFCGDDIKAGVAHADDLSYIFYAYYSWKLEKNSKEYLTIQRMIQMWINFAKSSNPNCDYTKQSPWKAVHESDDRKWLRISDELVFEEMPPDFQKKLNFWMSLQEGG